MKFDDYVKYFNHFVENELEDQYKSYIEPNFLNLQFDAFISGGEHEHLLNGEPDDILGDSQLVVFDAQGLQSNELIRDIVQLIICGLVEYKMSTLPKAVRKIFLIEEAIDFLAKGGTTSEFVAGLYRKGRKMGMEVILATQDSSYMRSCDDLTKNSILSNAQTKIILGFNTEESRKEARELLSLTDEHIFMIDNLKKDEYGKWREVFMMCGTHVFILRIDVSPESKKAFSTTPKDIDKINLYREKYGSYEGAITQIVADEEILNNN